MSFLALGLKIRFGQWPSSQPVCTGIAQRSDDPNEDIWVLIGGRGGDGGVSGVDELHFLASVDQLVEKCGGGVAVKCSQFFEE